MTRKGEKSALTDEQKADAARLKALIDSARKGPGQLTVETIAETSGLAPSFISQLSNGYRPMNLEQVVRLAKALNAAIEQISPARAKVLGGVRPYVGDTPPPPPPSNGDISGLDRALLGALRSLDPTVRVSIRGMIMAIAAAASENHAKFMLDLQQLSEARDAPVKSKRRKVAASKRRTAP